MSDFKQIQESNFSQFYLDNCGKQIHSLKGIIEKVQGEYTQLFDYIKQEIFSSDIVGFLNKKINEYISWIDAIKEKEDYKKDYRLKEIYNKRILDALNEFINIYQNEYLKKINKSIEDIKNLYEDLIISFDPPKINNSSDEIIELQMSNAYLWEYTGKEKNNYSSFYYKDNSFQKDNESLSDFSFECIFCKNKTSNYYCKHCHCYCCEACYNIYEKYDEEINHLFIRMDEKKKENEEQKNEFIKSSVNFIQNFIIKCNYIIKNENQNYVNPLNYKVFQYPIIQKEDDIKSQLDFLMEIKETYDLIKTQIDVDKTIDENVLNKILLNSLKKYFGEKQFCSTDFNDFDYDFITDE